MGVVHISPNAEGSSSAFASSAQTGRVVRWQVAPGAKVAKGAALVSCMFQEQVNIRSPHDGTVTEIFVKEGAEIAPTAWLATIEYCLHNIVVSGLCAVCGSVATAPTTVNVQGGFRVQLNQQEALTSRERTVTRLFEQKRLSLVLDLDHTLVHCSDDPRAPQFAEGAPNVCKFELGGKLLVLKSRPGLAQFLKDMHEHHFVMYVYTAGTRAYAERVCAHIDPTGAYFGSRVVARDDAPELGMEKSLERIFPVDDSMVVIVDDRDVWGGSANLLTCEPYHFFYGMHEVNNASWKPEDGDGDEAAALVADDSEMDAGLARISALLKKVHREFFYPAHTKYTLEQQLSGSGGDVKEILREIKKSVLKRVTMAFDPSTPNVAALYRRAELCGAKCVSKVDTGVTHLVAPGDTDLGQFAKALGVLVVHARWLELCDHNWSHVVEEPYFVYRVEGFKRKGDVAPPRSASPRIASVDKKEEDIDVDFAAAIDDI